MNKILFLAGLTLSLGLTACNDNESNSSRTPLEVRITDSPGSYDAIYLNIDKIEILTSGGRSTLDVESNPFDILEYTMGKDTVIASESVASGRIQEIRLILEDEGNSIVVDGIEHPLTTPSGQSSGVKLKIQDELKPNVAYTLLLDFDAAQSIVETGNGKYILKPVIRAIPNAVSGSITGLVLPAEANPKVYAIEGTDTIGAVTDIAGKFWIPGVPAGTFKIVITPESPYLEKIIEGVAVETGSVKDIGTITLTQE